MNLVNWLEECGMKNVQPMRVRIKNATYEAAAYINPYIGEGREFIYCLGQLPYCYRRKQSTCFTREGDPREWYICGYYPWMKSGKQIPSDSQNQYQPFGANFWLAPWEADGRIDDFEPTQYDRVVMEVEQQGEHDPKLTETFNRRMFG